jgi:hypothetical protein
MGYYEIMWDMMGYYGIIFENDGNMPGKNIQKANLRSLLTHCLLEIETEKQRTSSCRDKT